MLFIYQSNQREKQINLDENDRAITELHKSDKIQHRLY